MKRELLFKVLAAQGADATQIFQAEEAARRIVRASYEAASPSRLRKFSRNEQSGNLLAKASAKAIRNQARNLERNHDISRGALGVLVNNIVGPKGISVEPQPRIKASGEIHTELAKQMSDLWRDWCIRPEVTYQHNFAAVQRLACRTWLRDGEVFAQFLRGNVPNLDHGTRVPMSLELLEPDMIPFDLEDPSGTIRQGIVVNAWGQPKAYKVHKMHPGDLFMSELAANLKTISADNMLHVKLVDRIGQLRGVSIFASVITRLEDLKDYEESERIAAKIAASMAGYIKKGTPDLYELKLDENGQPQKRNMNFSPGMIFDDLMPGEEIGTIDTNRPNTNLPAHRDGQLRAAAAGWGASYSSISRNYDGNYGAQRQELIEQWTHYEAMAEHFTSRFVQPVWENFVVMARAAGKLNSQWLAQCMPETVDDALYVGQTMPWIDPKKEVEAWQAMEENTYISGPEIIRKRGGNPQIVLDQQEKWLAQKKAKGLAAPAPSPAATPNGAAQPSNPQQQEPAK